MELSNVRRQSLSSNRQAIRDLALGRAEEALHDLSTRARVLFLRNDRNRDVLNGDFGTVQKIRNGKIEIRLDRGGMKEIDPRVYPHLEHGYAATCHKLQGATLDRCHVLAPDNGMAGREWAYVAGSRAREAFHVHADRMTLLELAPDWSKSWAKETTLDYKGGQHERGMERDLCGARRNLGAAKDLVRRIDEALGSLGERHGLRGALSQRYFERTCRQDRSLEHSRATEELLISFHRETPTPRKQREWAGPELGP